MNRRWPGSARSPRNDGKAGASNAMKTIGDQQLLKRINRSVVLRLLRAQPGLSRARLASESGLTKSTVSALVRELIDDRWLSEAGARSTTASAGRRRRSPSTTGVRALIGVEVGVETMRVACVSLLGEVLDADDEPLRDGAPAQVSAPRRPRCARASGSGGQGADWSCRASASACRGRSRKALGHRAVRAQPGLAPGRPSSRDC